MRIVESKLRQVLQKWAVKESVVSDKSSDSADDTGEEEQQYYFYYKLVTVEDLTEEEEYPFVDSSLHILHFINSSDSSNTSNNNNNNTSNSNTNHSNNKRFVYIQLYDTELVDVLQKFLEMPSLLESDPYIELTALYYCIHDLRRQYEQQFANCGILKKFLNFVQDFFSDEYSRMDKMIASGFIDYESLWYVFDRTNEIYVIRHLEEEICIRYKAFDYALGSSRLGTEGKKVFALLGDIIIWQDGKFQTCSIEYDIGKFKGTRRLDSFHVNLLAENKNSDSKSIPVSKSLTRTKVLQYTEQVKRLTSVLSHVVLEGKQYFRKDDGINKIIREERAMIDYQGSQKYGSSANPLNINDEDLVELQTLSEGDELIVCPFVPIYTLGLFKRWGVAHVKNIQPVKYESDAFDHLVLSLEKKNTIQELVQSDNMADSFNINDVKYDDFIQKKGKSLVFLLYGHPGVGKTLTAEAVCEKLHRPLYSVHVGDLGTNPQEIEEALDIIGRYAVRWKAVILIDEVDIFVENRENSDITRNAMVGIFLKFLEYHNGIIFLTTNRLKSIDPAVTSRVSLFLCYKDLTEEQRTSLWKLLCQKWDVQISEETCLQELAKLPLNGREIRNYLRLSISTLKQRGHSKLTTNNIFKQIQKVMGFTQEFNKLVASPLGLYG